MSFAFKDLIDFSKIPIKVFWLLAIVTGILLFTDKDFLIKLQLQEFNAEYGKYFGIIFIVSAAFIILSIIYYLFDQINSLFKTGKSKRYFKEELKSLDPYEQSVMREFIVQNRKTVSMPIDNPVVAGLINKGFLKRVSNLGDGLYFPISLSKFADKYLKEDDLGVSSKMKEEELREIFSNRPKWAEDYFYKENFQ